jgi:hypothetical protein
MRAILVSAILASCAVPATATASEWIVGVHIVSGNGQTCSRTAYDKFLLIEEGSTLFLRFHNKRVLLMTVPLRPDGSADVESQFNQGTRQLRVRVKVPAGQGRRVIEFQDLKEGCGYRADPI